MPNIYIKYTPETDGCHRICYKQVSPVLDAQYCCMEDISISPAQIGVEQTFTIDVAVTPCSSGAPVTPVGVAPGTYTYNGYVQPCCAPDDGSTLTTAWDAPVDFVVV